MGTAQVDRRSSSSSSVWYDRNFKASDNFKDSDNFEILTEDHETLALGRKIVDNRKKNQKEDHRDNYYKNNNHKDYYDLKRRSTDRESGEISEDDDEEVSDSRKRRKSPKDDNNYNGNSHQTNGNPTIASSRWADAENSSPEEPELKKARVSTERSRSCSMSLTPEVANRHGQGSRSSSQSSEQTEKPESTSQKEERSSSHSYGSERGEDSDYSSKKILESSPNEFCDYEEETEEKEEAPDVLAARRFDMLKGCRNVDEFEKLNKINEGTYGIVYRARDKKSGEIVALKKVKMERQREGFPISSLREINILLSLYHPSIVNVKEVVVGSDVDKIFMVMEYMEHDLKGFMEHRKREKFSISEVKCLMLQLLEGVGYLHDNWVLHRDLKTSNLLFNNSGELKICDLGLARQYGSPLKTYTETVVTLWYRSPELLLGAKKYSTAVDVWSIGCIMAELLTNEPLFPGKTEIEQLDKIFRTLGTPSEEIWPGFKSLPGAKVKFVRQPYNRLREKFPGSSLSFYGKPTLTEQGFDLLSRLLTYDPERRITCEEALNHPWFKEVPLAKAKEFMPTLPPVNDNDRQSRRYQKSPDPLEEKYLKDSRRGEHVFGGLFG